MKLERVSTKGMSRAEWLVRRRDTIGGSDAAALVGMSKYATPYSVWADKTGRMPDQEDNEAMRLGRDLEDYVARRWSEVTGKKVRKENAMLYNPLYPFAHADVDRVVIGERAVLECKTTSTLDVKQFKGVDFPDKYYVQCVHYLAVTGYDRCYLAVLVFGKGFYTFTLERDQIEIDALMGAEKVFMETYVLKDVAPPVDGTKATSDAVKTIWAESKNDDSVDLFGRESLLQQYFAVKEQISELEQQKTEIENTIKNDLKENSAGRCDGFKVSFKSQVKNIFSAKDFAKAYPEIDLTPFYNASVSRPLKITKIKEQ